MKKKKIVKAKESEKEKLACSEDEGKQAEDGGDQDHDDSAQDVELIKKMIGEYLGDGAKDMSKEEEAEVHALASEAYQAHKELGSDDKEAYGHAGQAIKLAHHMSKKKAEKAEADPEGDKPVPPKKAAPSDDKKPAPKAKDVPDDDEDGASGEAEKKEDESESEENENENKESAKVKEYKTKLLKAEGRIAALEAQTKREEVSQMIDKTLKESGQPNSVTKRFREAAGEIKTKAEFESLWKIFLEGTKGGPGSRIDWGVLMEKSVSREDGGKKVSKSLDFSNCAEEN